MSDDHRHTGNDQPDLVKRFREGDRQAFREIARDYQQQVYGLAFKLCGKQFQAEDITQEVFLRVFTKYKSFEGRSELSTWIYRITVNVSRSYFKKESKHTNTCEISDDYLAAPSDNNSPEDDALDKEFRAAFLKELEGLSSKNHEAFVLKHMEGFTYEEMEEIIGASTAQLKMRVHRAREHLQKTLKKYL
jgi:RNA polymerase sigma-70 factor, ECF subfamily